MTLQSMIVKYLGENLGVFYLGITSVITTIMVISYKTARYFIKLNKEQSPNSLVCSKHDSMIEKHDQVIKDHEIKFCSLQETLDKMNLGIDSIVGSIATITNGNVLDIMWSKVNGSYRYLKDEQLRKFVMYKVRSFIVFVDRASRDIESDIIDIDTKLINILTSLSLGADDVDSYFNDHNKGDFCKVFHSRHGEAIDHYKKVITKIIKDPVNNHKQRFIDASTTFMQEFISTLINTWANYHNIDNISIDEELADKIKLDRIKDT